MDGFTCPHCGGRLEVTSGYTAFEYNRWNHTEYLQGRCMTVGCEAEYNVTVVFRMTQPCTPEHCTP